LDYLRYPSVFIPLGLFAGGAILSHNIGSNGSPTFTWSDGFFTAATSYNAGVGEEAFFRGYLMMNFRQSWGSDFWSLTASSVLFGAAHISSDNPYPWPQLIGGFYLGWLAQHDDWTLSRNVFVHAWWDIIAFISEFSSDTVHPKVMLPLVDARF
jgi:membrane protease YdiL (CAAX protease family)